ncbi:hypothetical protein F3G54_32290, partial [Pseudomonas aeruginosa]
MTEEEIIQLKARIKLRKAPGPDRIPPEIVTLAVAVIPDKIRLVLQKVLESGVFPNSWKTARLVLLRKPGKPAEDPAGHRPLCLLDCYGKLLESLILGRIEKQLVQSDCLQDSQYGFRKGRSTVDAANKLLEIAEDA